MVSSSTFLAAPSHAQGSAAAHRQCYGDVDAFQSAPTKSTSASGVDSLPLLVQLPFKTQPQPTAYVSCAACRGPTADSIDSRRRTEISQGRLRTRLAHRLPRRLEPQVLGLLQHCPVLQPDPCLTLRRILPLSQHNHPRAMAPPRRRPVAAVACSGSMLCCNSALATRDFQVPSCTRAVQHGACSRQLVACIRARAL